MCAPNNAQCDRLTSHMNVCVPRACSLYDGFGRCVRCCGVSLSLSVTFLVAVVSCVCVRAMSDVAAAASERHARNTVAKPHTRTRTHKVSAKVERFGNTIRQRRVLVSGEHNRCAAARNQLTTSPLPPTGADSKRHVLHAVRARHTTAIDGDMHSPFCACNACAERASIADCARASRRISAPPAGESI